MQFDDEVKMKEEPAPNDNSKLGAVDLDLEVRTNVEVSQLGENIKQQKQGSYILSTNPETLLRDDNITHNPKENINDFDEEIDIKENVFFQEFLETLEKNIDEIERIKQICRDDLVITRALFSQNNKVNELVMRFVKLNELSINTPWSKREQIFSTPSQRLTDHSGRNMQNEFDSVANKFTKRNMEQLVEYTQQDNKIEERPHRDLRMTDVLTSPFYDRTTSMIVQQT